MIQIHDLLIEGRRHHVLTVSVEFVPRSPFKLHGLQKEAVPISSSRKQGQRPWPGNEVRTWQSGGPEQTHVPEANHFEEILFRMDFNRYTWRRDDPR